MATAAGSRPAGAAAMPRRGVLSLFGLGTAGLLTVQALVGFMVFFWPRKRSTFGSVVSMGQVDNYKVGSITYKIDGRFYLVRLAQGFIALWQKCPHLGYASGRSGTSFRVRVRHKESEPPILVHGSRTKSSLPYNCYACIQLMVSKISVSSNDQSG